MSGLWEAACQLYAADGVRELCLDLQDRDGIDVPLLLALVWAWSRGRDGDPARVAALIETVRPWQGEVVTPLRAARRALRPEAVAGAALGLDAGRQADLKAAVQALELRAERLQLDALERAIDDWPLTEDRGSLDQALRPLVGKADTTALAPLTQAAAALAR